MANGIYIGDKNDNAREIATKLLIGDKNNRARVLTKILVGDKTNRARLVYSTIQDVPPTPDEPKKITFRIDGAPYVVEEGTTWNEWCYTTGNDTFGGYVYEVIGGYLVCNIGGKIVVDENGNRITDGDAVIVAGDYVYEAKTVTFTINSVPYEVDKGDTWELLVYTNKFNLGISINPDYFIANSTEDKLLIDANGDFVRADSDIEPGSYTMYTPQSIVINDEVNIVYSTSINLNGMSWKQFVDDDRCNYNGRFGYTSQYVTYQGSHIYYFDADHCEMYVQPGSYIDTLYTEYYA